VGAGGDGQAGGIVGAEDLRDHAFGLAEHEAVEVDVGADVELEPLGVVVRRGGGVGHDLVDHDLADLGGVDLAPYAALEALVLGRWFGAARVGGARGAEVAEAVGRLGGAEGGGIVVGFGGGELWVEAGGGAVGGGGVGDGVDEITGGVGDEEARGGVVEGEGELDVDVGQAAVDRGIQLAGEEGEVARGDGDAGGVLRRVDGLKDRSGLLAEAEAVEVDVGEGEQLDPLALGVVDGLGVGVEFVDDELAGARDADRAELVAVVALAVGRGRQGAGGVGGARAAVVGRAVQLRGVAPLGLIVVLDGAWFERAGEGAGVLLFAVLEEDLVDDGLATQDLDAAGAVVQRAEIGAVAVVDVGGGGPLEHVAEGEVLARLELGVDGDGVDLLAGAVGLGEGEHDVAQVHGVAAGVVDLEPLAAGVGAVRVGHDLGDHEGASVELGDAGGLFARGGGGVAVVAGAGGPGEGEQGEQGERTAGMRRAALHGRGSFFSSRGAERWQVRAVGQERAEVQAMAGARGLR
jgi:hypothetical protein